MVLEVEEKPELKGQKKIKNTKEALKWNPKVISYSIYLKQ